MALGGGLFTTQNKVLPGAYINFVSMATASSVLSERGIATMPLELDWGVDGEVFTVTSEDFSKNCLKLFGYQNTHEKMKGLRELFKNIHTLHAYKIGSGVKAANTFAEAKYTGVRGNDLKIVIKDSPEGGGLYDVETMLDTVIVDTQSVRIATALTANDYVTFKADATLSATAATPLTGGTNGTVSGGDYQTYLDKIESYTYNAMGVETTDDSVKSLCAAFCKRLRDEMGIKFQCVIHNHAADHMGVVNVKNAVIDDKWSSAALVYWVTGAIAGCAVNKSVQNRVYDGEFNLNVDYTQVQLAAAIKAGEFTVHRVNSALRVLEDVNSMVTTTENCGEVFKENQTVRVIDQLANDDAVLFATKYLGTVPNDASGRTSLWSDLVKIRQELQDIRAIENFNDADVTVEAGESKKSVVAGSSITILQTMSKLYMTNVIS